MNDNNIFIRINQSNYLHARRNTIYYYLLNRRLYTIFQQDSSGLQIGITHLLHFQTVFLPRILLESLEEDFISSNVSPDI
jgi:hypothetical protein